MGVIDSKSGALGVEVRGLGGGAVPILFLHGVGSDKSVWAPQLDHFAARRPAIAFDYPGYGESALRPGATRDDYAAAALDALDTLGIERAIVCGLSLGGVIAIAMHHRAPERCAALILADSFAAHPEGKAIFGRAVDASNSMTMRQLAEARAPLLLGAAASGALRDKVVETMGRIDPEAFRLGAAAVWLADQRERAAAIAVPTLVLVGDEDGITPPALSRELCAIIPSATLDVIGGAGHLANIEQPAAFNRAIDAFLTDRKSAIEG